MRLWNELVKSFAAIVASLFLNLKKKPHSGVESVASWSAVAWNTFGCLLYNYHLKNSIRQFSSHLRREVDSSFHYCSEAILQK